MKENQSGLSADGAITRSLFQKAMATMLVAELSGGAGRQRSRRAV